MEGESDARLVALALADDPRARESLIRRHLPTAFVAALALLRDASDAEDIAQECIMTAMERLHQCREPERFAAWLRGSVRHRVFNHLRRAKLRAALSVFGVRMPDARAPSELAIMRRPLLEALGKLTPVQREVVLMHDLESWTHVEIAATLGISEVASRQHLFVARKRLRAELAPAEEETDG